MKLACVLCTVRIGPEYILESHLQNSYVAQINYLKAVFLHSFAVIFLKRQVRASF